MKTLKGKIALMLTLCLVLSGAVPAYAEDVTAPEKTAETSEVFAETAEVSISEAEYEEAEGVAAVEAVEEETAKDEAGGEDAADPAEKKEQAAAMLGAGQDPVKYLDWDDTEKKLVEKTCAEYTVIDSTVEEPEGGYILECDKWYVVKGSVTFTKRIFVKPCQGVGVVRPTHLILMDGASLNAEKGIYVEASAYFTIYGQENSTGSLTASADYAFPGIGGTDKIIGSGVITINGGTITATGGARAPGIDGYQKVTINGGTVTANGGSLAAGIGGRYGKREGTTGGTVIINGGTVTAAGTGAAGIGYGYRCPSKSGTIHINGGTVTAHGGLSGEDITINEDMLIYAGSSRESARHSDKSGVGARFVLIDTGISYFVSHMKQNIDDPTVYVLEDKESLRGSVGFMTDAAAKDYSGFSAQDITQKEIAADGETTVYVKYNRNTYTVRFDTREICAEPEPIRAIYGSTVLADPGTLSAPGYDFNGWYKDSGCSEEFTVPQNVEIRDHDITVYAGWTPRNDTPYKVYHYYEDPDGSGEISLEIEDKVGTTGEYTAAEIKNRPGLRILPFTQKLIEGDGSTIVSIYYGLNIYAITFNANGHGTAPEPVMAAPGTAISEPEEKPSAAGYIFGGWYTEEECTNRYVFSTMPSEDKMLYAKWTPIRYTITWKDGTNVLRTEKVDYDTTPDYGDDPVKQGYEFLHWWPTVQKVTGDAAYYAIFFKPSEKYTVTWMLNDITPIDTTEVTEGEMPVHANPSVEGYVFIGWQPALAPVTGNVKYTAYFEERGTDKIAVSFNTDGGTFINTQVIDRYTAPVKPSDPQKTGYEFEGWYREAGFVTPYEFNEPFNTDMTLYAKWKKNDGKEYTITFTDWDGKLLASLQVEEGGLPVYPKANPARSGYIFTYWDSVITLATCDKTYKATYEKQSTGGGGGGSALTVKKAAVTFSPNWYADGFGVWRIKNSAGQVVTNAWLCDDAVTANGQNVWYLLTQDGAMLAAGLVQDNTGNFYSLETNHDGYFGMLRYTDGYYNCNGQQVYLKFSQKHDGSFGAVINEDGLEKLKAIYGVTKYGIGNENAVYTKTF